MTRSLPERDWKYMRKIKEHLLSSLCKQINQQSVAILAEQGNSEHEKYLKLYRYTEDSNRVIADCFDDWHRSTLFLKILELKRHGLMSKGQWQGISRETRERIKSLEQIL